MDTIVTHQSVTITRANCVRTAGEAGQVAWRIPAASAAGIVRSGPGAPARLAVASPLLLKYPIPWCLRKGNRDPASSGSINGFATLDRRSRFAALEEALWQYKKIQIYLLIDTVPPFRRSV